MIEWMSYMKMDATWTEQSLMLNYLSYVHALLLQPCLTLCNPMDCSTPGLPVHHQLPEFTQTHVHWVSDAIQPPPSKEKQQQNSVVWVFLYY